MKQSFCCFLFFFCAAGDAEFSKSTAISFFERSREPDFLGLNDNGDFPPCFTKEEDGKRIFM